MLEGFTRVGDVGKFPDGRGRAVSVDGVLVAVFRLGQRWFALQDACPHMGAALSDGKIIDDQVVCHWHEWKFDLTTGQGDMRQWACAAVYEIRVEDGGVYVKPPQKPDPPAQQPEEEEWIAWDEERFFKKKPKPES